MESATPQGRHAAAAVIPERTSVPGGKDKKKRTKKQKEEYRYDLGKDENIPWICRELIKDNTAAPSLRGSRTRLDRAGIVEGVPAQDRHRTRWALRCSFQPTHSGILGFYEKSKGLIQREKVSITDMVKLWTFVRKL